MSERASKPAEPGKGGPTHLETVEFEPGAFNDLAAEDIERLKRGEALPPRAPVPVAGGDAREVPVDATPIDLPNQAAAYEGPRELPSRTNHNTFEMQTVAVDSEVDPRRAPTQRKLRSPVEKKDTIPDLVRREPTLRGLNVGAPGAEQAPPSAGPAPVVVPGADAPGWLEPASEIQADSAEPAERRGDEPVERTAAQPRSRANLGKVGIVLGGFAIVLALVVFAGSRKQADGTAPQPTAAEVPRSPHPGAQPVRPAPAVATTIESSSSSPVAQEPPPTSPPSSEKRKPAGTGPSPSTPSSGPAPSAKPPAPPDPDRPFL